MKRLFSANGDVPSPVDVRRGERAITDLIPDDVAVPPGTSSRGTSWAVSSVRIIFDDGAGHVVTGRIATGSIATCDSAGCIVAYRIIVGHIAADDGMGHVHA